VFGKKTGYEDDDGVRDESAILRFSGELRNLLTSGTIQLGLRPSAAR
jgi:hypothetical protein